MKTTMLLLLWGSLVGYCNFAAAQSTLDDLLTEYKSLSQEAAQSNKKRLQRKQDRAAINLVNYIQEHGYPLTIATPPSATFVVYAQSYPDLGAPLDTLEQHQQIQVYDKDEHGYYSVSTEAGEGYVQGLAEQVAGDKDHPIHLLDEMLERRLAVDRMLEQSRRDPKIRFERYGPPEANGG